VTQYCHRGIFLFEVLYDDLKINGKMSKLSCIIGSYVSMYSAMKISIHYHFGLQVTSKVFYRG
jgi:hypothetical protein